jgi:hypothetical protein
LLLMKTYQHGVRLIEPRQSVHQLAKKDAILPKGNFFFVKSLSARRRVV